MAHSIILIGGHGKVALLAEPLLVEAGHTVHALVRNPDHIAEVEATGARAHLADVENMSTGELSDLMAELGATAVVWSAGAGGGNPQRTYAVDRDAAIRSMDAALAAGVKRYIMVSYYGAGTGHGVPADNSFFAYAEAKAAADNYLRATDLDFTLLGPGALTTDPATGIETGLGREDTDTSREAVAQVIVATLEDPSTIGKAIAFTNGTVPVPQAVAQAPQVTNLQ